MLIGFIWLRTYQYFRQGISHEQFFLRETSFPWLNSYNHLSHSHNSLPIYTVSHNQHHCENIKSRKRFLGRPRRPPRVINYWVVCM